MNSMTRQIEAAAYLLIFLHFLRRISRKVLLKYTVPGLLYRPGENHWLCIKIFRKDGKEETWPCVYNFSTVPNPAAGQLGKRLTDTDARHKLEQALAKLRDSTPKQVFLERGSYFSKVEYSIIPQPDDSDSLAGYVKFKLYYGIVTSSRIRMIINGTN